MHNPSAKSKSSPSPASATHTARLRGKALERPMPIMLMGVLALALALVAVYFEPRFLTAIALQSCDLLLKTSAVPPQSDRIIVVDVDNDSLKRFGQWPWPRFLLARLTDRLWEAGADVVVFDAVFPEPDRTSPAVIRKTWEEAFQQAMPLIELPAAAEDFDRIFAESLAGKKSVLGCYMEWSTQPGALSGFPSNDVYRGLFYEKGLPQRVLLPQASGLIASIPPLQEAASGIGFFNTTVDQDNIVRRTPLVIALPPSRIYPALFLEAARLHLNLPRYGIVYDDKNFVGVKHVRLNERIIPTDANGRMALNFRSGPFPTIPAAEVLTGRPSKKRFQGKVVLIGSSATGLHDLYATPRHTEYPGIGIQATALDNVLAGDILSEPRWMFLANLAAIAAGGLLLIAIVTRTHALVSVLVMLSATSITLSTSVWCLRELHLVVNPSHTILAWGFTFLAVIVMKYWQKEVVEELNIRLQRTNLLLENEIAEHKKTEIALREASAIAMSAAQIKSEFLANMSHEIRTPMNGIIGLTDLALRRALPPRQRDYFMKIRASGRALLNVINDVLDFSKIEAGKLSVEKTEFDLQIVLDEIADLFAEPSAARKIPLVIHRQASAPTALIGDPLRLRQVLINLIGNAMKFTPSGEVAVRVMAEARSGSDVQFLFAIRDTGIGIPPDKLGFLFQPFQQADGSTTRKYGGSGLGLAITQSLVQLMSGFIQVESEPGKGSTFSISIPFQAQAADAPAPAPLALRGLRLLVATPHESARLMLREYLDSWECRTQEAASGEEILAALSPKGADPCQVIVLDRDLPGTDALALARAIRSRPDYRQVPMLLMAPLGEDESLLQSDFGISALVTKPVKPSELQAKLIQALNPEASLSAAEEAAAPAAPALPAEQPLRGARVLLAEDHPINREVAVENLREYGIETDCAVNGFEALKAVHEHAYDAVLMDIQMPGMDGYEATRKIRVWEQDRVGDSAETPPLPIIAMTAHAIEGERNKCMAAGLDDYIAKPIDPAQLFAVLCKWIPPRRGSAAAAASRPVILCTEAAPGAGAPQAPGVLDLDRETGLKRVQNNRALYSRLLRDFAEGHANEAQRIQDAWEKGEAEKAMSLAHNLKGIAGNLGADRLFNTVKQVEAALRDPDPATASERLHELDAALSDLLRIVDEQEAATDEAAAEGPDLMPIGDLLSRLGDLLAEHNAAAEKLTAALARQLGNPALAGRVQTLVAQVNAFAFTDAQATLRALESDLKGNPNPQGDEHVPDPQPAHCADHG